jgi:hypothetical protein
MRCSIKIAIVLALAGCETGGHHREPYTGGAAYPHAMQMISTGGRTYRVGAPVSIRLTNTTDRAVGYNLCRAKLERSHDGDWQEIMPSLGEVCTAELRSLRPGQSATFVFRTPAGARGGDYRVRAFLEDQRAPRSIEAISNMFMLQRDSD